ncbi:integrase catalytic domain-containing protein [Trichonephila clavipes]|nr:integrase catalytic domain-containing protein [Trichonephila clavipes]
MQRLWLLELGWSDELPFKEQKEWRRFIDSLKAVNNISIDRCIVIHTAESIELHAFSDASEKAYGSSIYLKSISALGEVKFINLVPVTSGIIASEQNPADVLSRGLLPESFVTTRYGGMVLSFYRVLIQLLPLQNQPQRDGFDCELRIQGEKKRGPLTTSEVNDAETWLIKQDQSGINLSDPSGNLKSLNIFQDDKGILRVGGRLEKASIPYSQKHPAILAKKF